LTYSVAADYVFYDDGNDRVISPGRYSFGFSTPHAFRDYLTLGDSSVDLLDRDKLRVAGMVSIPPFPPVSVSADEEDVVKRGVHAIDGPVRVTRVSTGALEVETIGTLATSTATLFAYRSLAVQLAPIEIPGGLVQITYQRTSMDWNERVVGMVYYDANNPAGVTVDGITDTIITTPSTRWTQVTSVTGTVVNVSQIPADLGGTQSTYYKDDADFDAGDTGDHRSYGDAGLQVYDPNPGTYTVLGHTYFLTGVAANVGSTYASYYDNPIHVSVATFTPPTQYIYLPFVAKSY
jgi:phage terminase large subunit-like protein